jgi:hypothetical protein
MIAAPFFFGDAGALHAPNTVVLKHDGFWMNHDRALAYCLRMIFSESRYTLFRIML